MRKPRVMERWSLPGRLRTRLTAIAAQVKSRELPRMEGGDRVLAEVVREIGTPRDAEERALLADAQLLRASFYLESSGATRVEAAQALLEAYDFHRELPVDPERSTRIAKIAERLVPELRSLGSRRHLLRSIVVLLEVWPTAGLPLEMVASYIEGLPELVHEVVQLRGEPIVPELLRALSSYAGIARIRESLEQIRSEALRYFIATGDSERAMDLDEQCPVLDAEGRVGLALIMADENRCDARARAYYADTLRRDPSALTRLDMSLRRASYIGPKTLPNEIDDREALSLELSKILGPTDWLYRNLAMAAAHRGDDEVFVAAFAATVDLNGDFGVVAEHAVATLLDLGFAKTAKSLGKLEPVPLEPDASADPLRLLAHASLVISGSAEPKVASELAMALAELSAGLRLPKGTEARLHRLRGLLLKQLGRNAESVRSLERALSLRPERGDIALELAEACQILGDEARSRAFLEFARERGKRRSAAIIEASLHERANRTVEALRCLEIALDTDSDDSEILSPLAEHLEVIRVKFAELTGKAFSESTFLTALSKEVPTTGVEALTEREDRDLRQRASDLARSLGDFGREAAFLIPLTQRTNASKDLVFRAAEAAARGGMSEVASDLLHRLRKRGSMDSRTAWLSGLMELRAGAIPEARALLEDSQNLGGDSPSLMLALGIACSLDGDGAAGLRAFTAVPESAPPGTRLRALELSADILERNGRYEEALVKRERILEIDDDPARRPALGRIAVRVGLHRIERGEFGADLLERGLSLLRELPSDYDRPFVSAAQAALGRDETSVARQHLEEAVAHTIAGGDASRIESLIAQAKGVLTEDHPAQRHIQEALREIWRRRSAPSLGNLRELLRRGAEAEAMAMVESMLSGDATVASLHHWALLLHRKALQLEVGEQPTAFPWFERAHAAWKRFLSHGDAVAHLVKSGAAQKVASGVLEELPDLILMAHVELAAQVVDRDPLRAEAHLRMVMNSPLAEGRSEALHGVLFDTLADSLDTLSLEQRHARLSILVAADPENHEARRRLFHLDAEAIAVLLADAIGGKLCPKLIVRMNDRVSQAAALRSSIKNEREPTVARALGYFQLGSAAIACWRDNDAPRARASIESARSNFALAGGVDPTAETVMASIRDADPGRDVFAEVKAAIADGDHETAESRLEQIYAGAISAQQHARSREAITLLNEVRSKKSQAKQDALGSHVRAAMDAERFRDVLEMTGGKAGDPTLSSDIGLARVKALIGLGRAALAKNELHALRIRSRTEAVNGPLLGALERRVDELLNGGGGPIRTQPGSKKK